MKGLKGNIMFGILLVLSLTFFMAVACDRGETITDQVTGNDAVTQYQETKKDIDDVVDRQNERLNSINKDSSDDDMLDEITEEAD